MDFADIGNATAEHCTADAERRQRGKSDPETDPDFDGEHCVDCDESIHPARLKLGRVRCIGCQQELEKRQAMRNH